MESSRFGPEPVCSSMIVSVRPPAALPVLSALRSSLVRPARESLPTMRYVVPGWPDGSVALGLPGDLVDFAPGHHRHDHQVGQPEQQDDEDVAGPEPAALAAARPWAAEWGRREARAEAGSDGVVRRSWCRAGGWARITRVSSGRGADGRSWRATGRVGSQVLGFATLAVEPGVVGSVLGTAVPGTIRHAHDATVRGMSNPADIPAVQPALPPSYGRVTLGVVRSAREANLLGNIHGALGD